MARDIIKKAATETQLLMLLQSMGFAIDKIILDCKIHNCGTVYSERDDAAFYTAYCSENAHYLCAGLRDGAYTLFEWCHDQYFDEENVTKEELMAILMCHDD